MLRCPPGLNPRQQPQPQPFAVEPATRRAVAPAAFIRGADSDEGDVMRESPDLYVVVPGLGAVAANSVSVAYPLIWPARGKIVQVMCFPLADGSAAGMTSLGFSASIEGGASQGFVSAGGQASSAMLLFAALPGTVLVNAGLATAFHDRQVQQNEKWTLTFQNFHGVNAYTPYLAFGLKRL